MILVSKKLPPIPNAVEWYEWHDGGRSIRVKVELDLNSVRSKLSWSPGKHAGQRGAR